MVDFPTYNDAVWSVRFNRFGRFETLKILFFLIKKILSTYLVFTGTKVTM